MQAFRRGARQRRARLRREARQRARGALPRLRGLAPGLPARERPHPHASSSRARATRATAWRRAASATLFFLPRNRAEARGDPGEARAARAGWSCPTTGPASSSPAQNAAAAREAACPLRGRGRLRRRAPRAARRRRRSAARTIRPKVYRAAGRVAAAAPRAARSRARRRAPARPARSIRWTSRAPTSTPSSPAARSITRAAGRAAAAARAPRPSGPRALRARTRSSTYHVDRNDPSRDATSALSPYLHFGMMSARRAALAGARTHGARRGARSIPRAAARAPRALVQLRARAPGPRDVERPARVGPRHARGAHADRRYADLSVAGARGGALARPALERGDERAARRAAWCSPTRGCSGASCRSLWMRAPRTPTPRWCT